MPRLSKRLWLCLAAGVLIATAPTVLRFSLTKEKRDKANFAKIELGMTKQEAQTILGGPPGNYASQPSGPVFSPVLDGVHSFWYFDDGTATVYWDADGKIENKLWLSPNNTNFFREFLKKIGL